MASLQYKILYLHFCPSVTDESSLKMNSVKHIPQTLASHSLTLQVNHRTETRTADMLKADPRDSFYKGVLFPSVVLDACL